MKLAHQIPSFLISILIFYISNLIEAIPSSKFNQDESKSLSTNSFSKIYQLDDGEVITKFKWKNLTAIETKFNHLDLIQIVKDENRILQFWLSNGQLIDCEYSNDLKMIENFHNEFKKINPNKMKDANQFKYLIEERNLTNTATIPSNLQRLTEYENYEGQCSELHQKIQNHYLSKQDGNGKHKKRRSLRTRRSDSLVVFPGTKWCGKGSNSKNFEDLGDYSFADRCCRDHDQCKFSIGPFENQYHLFNYRFHYISHCSCDERFRSCLKVANSGAANLVGKIYFNVVKTKCFMFKLDDLCTERSWWGSCLQTKRRKRAVYRDPMAY